MRQLKIGGYKTYDNWGLLLTHKEVSPPEIKDYIIEVPGTNGTLDLTESMGGIRYADREASFTMVGINGTYENRIRTYHDLVKYIHGQIREIEEPDRPGEVLLGRWSVGPISMINGDIFGFKISSNKVCPFYLGEKKIVTRSISNGGIVNITYDGGTGVWPTVEFTGNGTIRKNGDKVNYNLTSKAVKYGNIVLDPGANTFAITGSGTIKFEYRNALI